MAVCLAADVTFFVISICSLIVSSRGTLYEFMYAPPVLMSVMAAALPADVMTTGRDVYLNSDGNPTSKDVLAPMFLKSKLNVPHVAFPSV